MFDPFDGGGGAQSWRSSASSDRTGPSGARSFSGGASPGGSQREPLSPVPATPPVSRDASPGDWASVRTLSRGGPIRKGSAEGVGWPPSADKSRKPCPCTVFVPYSAHGLQRSVCMHWQCVATFICGCWDAKQGPPGKEFEELGRVWPQDARHRVAAITLANDGHPSSTLATNRGLRYPTEPSGKWPAGCGTRVLAGGCSSQRRSGAA